MSLESARHPRRVEATPALRSTRTMRGLARPLRASGFGVQQLSARTRTPRVGFHGCCSSAARRSFTTVVSRMDVLLWIVVPYVCLTTFVVGHIWRYRTGKLTFTPRSERQPSPRGRRVGVILFHLGLL